MDEEKSNLEKVLEKEVVRQHRDPWHALWDSYFKPKTFEKSGKLYEALGVPWFSKYWINGGSYWTRRGQSPMVAGRKKKDLENYIQLTQSLEGIHLALLPVYSALTAVTMAVGWYTGTAITIGANVAVNLYPIMSQRYNRNRAIKLLERLNQEEFTP